MFVVLIELIYEYTESYFQKYRCYYYMSCYYIDTNIDFQRLCYVHILNHMLLIFKYAGNDY